MPNIASVLKEEIRRLAKREIKAETGKTKRAVAQYRHEIATLKQIVASQQKELARLKAQGRKQAGQGEVEEQEQNANRFSPRSVKAQRTRLKLSAANYGKLIGVSGLTVYNWEHGKSRPRQAQFASLVKVRGIGRRAALKQLELLKAEKATKTIRRKKPK